MRGSLILGSDTKFTEIYARNPRDTNISLVQQFDNAMETKTKEVFVKKLKDLHGICCIDVQKLEQEELEKFNIVDTSLQIQTNSASPENQERPLITQVHEFLQQPSFVPNFFYVNNMYIQLLQANIGNRAGKNITVELQVKDNDKDLNAPGLSVSKKKIQKRFLINIEFFIKNSVLFVLILIV